MYSFIVRLKKKSGLSTGAWSSWSKITEWGRAMLNRIWKAVSAATIFVALLAATTLGFAATLQAPGGGTVRALVIGINKYPDLPGHDLHGAEPDAEDMNSALAADGVK